MLRTDVFVWEKKWQIWPGGKYGRGIRYNILKIIKTLVIYKLLYKFKTI